MVILGVICMYEVENACVNVIENVCMCESVGKRKYVCIYMQVKERICVCVYEKKGIMCVCACLSARVVCFFAPPSVCACVTE